MENLFAYGTLKDKRIQETIFGKVLTGTPDTVTGFITKEIQIEEEFGVTPYPIIVETKNPEDVVIGVLYQLTEYQLEQADIYEGMHYKRIQVKLESNEIAWTYLR
jgi:gamma-glutamylcyclotransferase (GGCT)/AIG2-like uncharacterized protein YtfP